MKREVMQAAGLHMYAEIGLILFIVAFIFVLARVILLKRDEIEELEKLPLDDDADSAASK